MPREYQHIQQYEKEIIEFWEQGKTLREIGEKFEFTKINPPIVFYFDWQVILILSQSEDFFID